MKAINFFLILIILFFTYLQSFAQSKSEIKLSLPIDSIPIQCISQIDENVVLRIGRNYITTGIKCTIDKFDYLVGIDKTNRIIFYSIYDTNFLINNFRYITEDKQILDSLRTKKIVFEPGWTAYIKLLDDWNLAFDNEDIEIIGSTFCLKKDAIPKFLFKRRIDYDKDATVPKSWGQSKSIKKNN